MSERAPANAYAAQADAWPGSSAQPQAQGGAPVLDEAALDELRQLLEGLPAPLEPLDLAMLDGFLAGVLLQPTRLTPAQWMPFVADAQGRPVPLPNATARQRWDRLQALVQARWLALDASIEARQWFDPWIFELDTQAAEADGADEIDEIGEIDPLSAAVYPWVIGFAAAQESFPDLMDLDEAQITEPLALIYQHLDADDLEDADALLEEIESIEPPQDLADAVERLVRAVLLLADVSRPKRPSGGARPNPAAMGHRRPGRASGGAPSSTPGRSSTRRSGSDR
jgi:uncharacterized protein